MPRVGYYSGGAAPPTPTPMPTPTPVTVDMRRRESVKLQGTVANVLGVTASAALLSAATDPVVVEYEGGQGVDPVILSNTGGETTITVLKEGLYNLKWEAQVNISIIRPYISLGIWLSTDTISTADPLAIVTTQYMRGSDDDQVVHGYADIQIDADDTIIQVATFNLLDPDTTPAYTLDADSKLYFTTN